MVLGLAAQLGPTLFPLYINGLADDVTCDIAIYADDTAFHSKCDQASYLWQQLEVESELESDLQETGLGQEKPNWFRLTGLITLVLSM